MDVGSLAKNLANYKKRVAISVRARSEAGKEIKMQYI